MNVVSTDEGDQQNALTNSDLKGLLKAASLTEFHPDVVQESNSKEFEKSNSLFDLVRSNLVDTDPSTVEAQLDISNLDKDTELANGQTQQSENTKEDNGFIIEDGTKPQSTNLSDKIGDLDVSDLEPSLIIKDVFTLEIDDIKTDGELKIEIQDQNIDNDELASKKETQQVGEVLTNITEIADSAEFLSELKKAQTTFDQKLDDEKKEFSTVIEAMFGASSFIATQMENEISDVVLAIASDLAGTKIDVVPEEFSKKISTVAKQIIGNNDEITVYVNVADYAKLKTARNFSELKYTFLENQTLRRGEFEVTSRKSSAGVSLFNLSDGD
jgi:flagellar biosynthesis/type III secretory pathway protein FliH